MTEQRASFFLGDSQIPPGSRAVVDIPFGKLYTHTELNIGAHVVHGRQDGPILLVTAALHGDEINGVEVIRRLLTKKALKNRVSWESGSMRSASPRCSSASFMLPSRV